MSKYKLVPVEPTAEMMATGSIEMGARDEDARTVWKAMIAAAPAVQGEPVALTDAEILGIAGRVESCPVSPWWLKDDVAIGDVRAAVLRFARALLVAAPQPAEQERFKRFNGQECWMWAGDGSDRLETLTCPVVIKPAELMAIINRVAPAPDVAGLVDALERSVAGFDALSGMASLDAGARNYARQKALELNAVIAAYRKGGEA